MKITFCGSIAFYDEMLDLQRKLEEFGHEIKLPPNKIKNEVGDFIDIKDYYQIRKNTDAQEGWIWDRKAEAIGLHFEKINWADVILVANFDKNNIAGYIGGNTLMEMGVAFFLGKPIFLLKEVPEVSYKEEILGMKPVILGEDLSLVK